MKKIAIALLMTVGCPSGQASDLDLLLERFRPVALVLSFLNNNRQTEAAINRDKAAKAYYQELAFSEFLSRDAAARRQDLLTQKEEFFIEKFGRPKEVVRAIHNALCLRQEADVQFVVGSDLNQPSDVKSVAETEQKLPSENILLLGHIRGQKPQNRNSWRPVLTDDAPDTFDGIILAVSRLPAKIEVVGDIDSRQVNTAWYRDLTYKKNPDGSFAKDHDGRYILVPKSKDELDKEIVKVGTIVAIRSLSYMIPKNAERLSLRISIWDSTAGEATEQVEYVLCRPRPGTQASCFSVIPPLRRNVVNEPALAMSANLANALFEIEKPTSEVRMASLPTS